MSKTPKEGSIKKTVLSLVVETRFVEPTVFTLTGRRIEQQPLQIQKWDCLKFTRFEGGIRLLDEILRRCQVIENQYNISCDGIALSIPGRLNGNSIVLSSTRLGITQQVNVTEFFEKYKAPQCYVFHDTECLGLGEIMSGILTELDLAEADKSSFAYIFVDEGVGSTLFLEGKPYIGAGSAGHLGRLVVAPLGQYNPVFLSKGSLEIFASRPWVSSHIVGQFLTQQDKKMGTNKGSESFRKLVKSMAMDERTWNSLQYEAIAEGLEAQDPIAVSVIEEAAKYLGLAINSVITIANPPYVIIGGKMISELPSFYDKVISYARQFSWKLAWNQTTILQARSDRKAQGLGAVEVFRRLTEDS